MFTTCHSRNNFCILKMTFDMKYTPYPSLKGQLGYLGKENQTQ